MRTSLSLILIFISNLSWAIITDSDHRICIVNSGNNNDNLYIGCTTKIDERDSYYPIRSENWTSVKLSNVGASKLDPGIFNDGRRWCIGNSRDSNKHVYLACTDQDSDPLDNSKWWSHGFDFKSDKPVHPASSGNNWCLVHTGSGTSDKKVKMTCTKDFDSDIRKTDSSSFITANPPGTGDSKKDPSIATDGIRWCVVSSGGSNSNDRKIYLNCSIPNKTGAFNPLENTEWTGGRLGPAGESKKLSPSIATDGRRWCITSGGGSNNNKHKIYIACSKSYSDPTNRDSSNWSTADLSTPLGESKNSPSIATDGLRWCISSGGGSNDNDKKIWVGCTTPRSDPTIAGSWSATRILPLGESKRNWQMAMGKSCYFAGEKPNNVNECCKGLKLNKDGICSISANYTPGRLISPAASLNNYQFSIEGNGQNAKLNSTDLSKWHDINAQLTAMEALFTSVPNDLFRGGATGKMISANHRKRNQILGATQCLNAKMAILDEAGRLSEKLKNLPGTNERNRQMRAPIIQSMKNLIDLTNLNNVEAELMTLLPSTITPTMNDYISLSKLLKSNEQSLKKEEIINRLKEVISDPYKCLQGDIRELKCNNQDCNYDEFQIAALAILKAIKMANKSYYSHMTWISHQFEKELIEAQEMATNEKWVCDNAAIRYCTNYRIAGIDNSGQYDLYADPVIPNEFASTQFKFADHGVISLFNIEAQSGTIIDTSFIDSMKEWMTSTAYYKNYSDSYGKINSYDNLGEIAFKMFKEFSYYRPVSIASQPSARPLIVLYAREFNQSAINYFDTSVDLTATHIDSLDQTYSKFKPGKGLFEDSSNATNLKSSTSGNNSETSYNELIKQPVKQLINGSKIDTSSSAIMNSKSNTFSARTLTLNSTGTDTGQTSVSANGKFTQKTTDQLPVDSNKIKAMTQRLKQDRLEAKKKSTPTSTNTTTLQEQEQEQEYAANYQALKNRLISNGDTARTGVSAPSESLKAESKMEQEIISGQSNDNNEDGDDDKNTNYKLYKQNDYESDSISDDKDTKVSSFSHNDQELSEEETENILSNIGTKYSDDNQDTLWKKLSNAYVRSYPRVLYKKVNRDEKKVKKEIDLGKPMDIK